MDRQTTLVTCTIQCNYTLMSAVVYIYKESVAFLVAKAEVSVMIMNGGYSAWWVSDAQMKWLLVPSLGFDCIWVSSVMSACS